MRSYVAHGYAIGSEIELPLPLGGKQPGMPSLLLRRGRQRAVPRLAAPGELLALLETRAETHYAVSRGDDGLVLRFGGCVEFVADPRLRKVEFHVEPGLDEGLVAVLASGTLLAIRLLMDGRLVLHASALDAGGRAVAFCGAPGMGKSTLSVLLSQAGMPLVSDDVLRVDLDDVQPMVWPGATESRLRPHSDQLVELAPPSHVRLTADGRRAVSPPQLCDNTIPLAAVLVPLPTRALEEPQMRRLGQAEALRSLVRFPRVIGWREPSSSLQQFQLLGELVERVPVAEVRVPWGPPFPPRVAEQLVSLVDMLVRNRPTPNAQK